MKSLGDAERLDHQRRVRLRNGPFGNGRRSAEDARGGQ